MLNLIWDGLSLRHWPKHPGGDGMGAWWSSKVEERFLWVKKEPLERTAEDEWQIDRYNEECSHWSLVKKIDMVREEDKYEAIFNLKQRT